jgi:protein-S-isoprenylcysteine O-methyltransferase Ste14
MALREEFERSGNWFFIWRSYLPAVMIAPMYLAMLHFQRPLGSHRVQEQWEIVCLVVSFLGLLVRVLTVGYAPAGTSGRNTTKQIADVLNTTGMYSMVRHPLYLGNFLIWLGISMFCLEWWLVAIFCLTYTVYYERIMFAEEEFLRRKFGGEYEQWSTRTPAILPNFRLWRRPAMSFSWRSVLRREYPGVLGIVAVFFTLETLEHFIVDRRWVIEWPWAVFGTIGVVGFIALRTIKKWTPLLNVKGR